MNPTARLGLPTLLALTVLLPSVQPAAAEVWEKSFESTGAPEVVVRSNDANIHVDTWDRPTVAFRVTTTGWRIGSGGVTIDAHQSGRQIDLLVKEPVWSVSFSINRSVRIEVSVPAQSDLEVGTGDGRVTIGPVAGRTRVTSGDGTITVAGLKGDIWLHSGDGAIVGSGLDGKLEAHTGDGPVRLDGRFDALDVTTGDGHIVIRAETGSKLDSNWLIRTGDGGLDLSLPRGLKANLDAHTGDGGILLDLPVLVSGNLTRRTVVGSLNGGGPPLMLRSGDGSIRIGPS